MSATHPNFMSMHGKIQTADDIYDAVGIILVHQRKFQKRYPPMEAHEWTEETTENFKIDLEMIDRVYHVECQSIEDMVYYELAVRMHYVSDDPENGSPVRDNDGMDRDGRPLYLHVKVCTRYTWDGIIGDGEIYMTYDPQVFLKSTINTNCNPQAIWHSMVEVDGLQVEEPSEFDLKPVGDWKTVPMLKFLCHMAVYQRQDTLRRHLGLLPHRVARDVEEFLRVRLARDHRDQDFLRYPDYLGVTISSSLNSTSE